MMDVLQTLFFILAVYLPLSTAKEPLNITCTLDPLQITVEIFTTRPLFNVQLKNADRSCDPQQFTPTSIRFVIQNYQLGVCGFVRSESSTNGLDGTFWNNIIWKEKPTSPKTMTTKVKCAQKLSAMLNSPPPVMPLRVQVIHLPFGAFPSAFSGLPFPSTGDASGNVPIEMSGPVPTGMSGLPPGLMPPSMMPGASSPSGLMSPFPSSGGIPLNSGVIVIRSGLLPSARSDDKGPSVSKTGNGARNMMAQKMGGLPIIRRRR